MYPQPPNVLKRETKISQWYKCASPWHVKASLAAITASCLLRYDRACFTHLVWGIFAILLCRSYQALWGWMGNICGHPFSALSRDVQLDSSQSVHSRPLTELLLSLYYLNCVLRVIVLGYGAEVLSYEDNFSFSFLIIIIVPFSFLHPWHWETALETALFVLNFSHFSLYRQVFNFQNVQPSVLSQVNSSHGEETCERWSREM